ncbi:universal stress protein [Halobacteriales archaeon SW_7_65_23]|nr:MAG: universal stress protein [Halobacteriales archaeon SW_7_65_23]
MYANILYPTDGSESAEAAIEDVRDLAETYDATVHVLYVVDTTHAGLGSDPDQEKAPGMVGHPEGGTAGMVGDRSTAEEVQRTLERQGESIVEEAREQLGDVDATTAVRAGVPYEAILDYAETEDIDLIVMGTHGRTGLDRYLLGSVTEKVVRTADVPVVTV